jgi:hypothetical protein
MQGSAGAYFKAGTIARIRYISGPSCEYYIEYEFDYWMQHARLR